MYRTWWNPLWPPSVTSSSSLFSHTLTCSLLVSHTVLSFSLFLSLQYCPFLLLWHHHDLSLLLSGYNNLYNTPVITHCTQKLMNAILFCSHSTSLRFNSHLSFSALYWPFFFFLIYINFVAFLYQLCWDEWTLCWIPIGAGNWCNRQSWDACIHHRECECMHAQIAIITVSGHLVCVCRCLCCMCVAGVGAELCNRWPD